MGPVTTYLVNLVKKQVHEHKLVLWFDPEGHYQELIGQLTLPETPIVAYKDSFFALRYEVEPYLNDVERPRLLIYVPLDPSATHRALIELQMMAAQMFPGHHSLNANTRLSLIARYSLKPLLGERAAQEHEKSVQAGKLSLAELDKLAERGTDARQGVISLIFGSSNAADVALTFLNSEHYDEELLRKEAVAELATLFNEAFGIESIEHESLAAYRTRLVRYLLATDLIQSLQKYGTVPDRLASVASATQSPTRANCAALVHTWQLRRDLVETYREYAIQVEQELKLNSLSCTLEQLMHTATFLSLEKHLQATLIEALLHKPADEYIELARTRQSSFWGQYVLEIQANWKLIVAAGRVLLETERIEQALKSSPSAEAIFQAYTASDLPWSLLDTHHRYMELFYHNLSPLTLDERLGQLLARARQRYMEVGSVLAEQFLRGFQAEHFQLPGVLRQVEIFEKKVRPHFQFGKVAYVLVDALRYEMAAELARSLASDADPDLIAVLGTVPTITVVGMAALLPGAQKHPRLVTAGSGKLALELDGVTLKDRKSRLDFLKTHAGVTVFDARLDELFPHPAKKVLDGISKAELVLITSQEIDQLGEDGHIALARKTMDEALRQLQQAFRILGQLGVQTIICTADHGYLFGAELSNDMKIDAPGGKEIELHRRAWIGQGGTSAASYLRAPIADLGLESELDIAVPWNFACFKVRGGAEAYFHGGMSPQELFIPVLTLKSQELATGTPGDIVWQLTLGSQKITTRVCSVQIKGQATGLFQLAAPRVRLEIRSAQGCISLSVGATYGFDEGTSDIQLQSSAQDPQQIEPDSVTLAIMQELPKISVSLHLLDAASGVELQRLESIEMNISL